MKNHKIIIALDGHSSCGKSTYAKRIAKEIGYAYIDTGAMYRSVTLAAMEKGLFDKTDAPSIELIEELLKTVELNLKFNPEKQRTEIFLNGRMVEDQIRRMEVADHVSYIATISPVRKKMVEYQRKLGEEKGVVMDGRDIGTVVLPGADIKIFMDATTDERTDRRVKELKAKNLEVDRERIKEEIIQRDLFDSTRDIAPLKPAKDAIIIDTSNLTIAEQVQSVIDIVNEVLKTLPN